MDFIRKLRTRFEDFEAKGKNLSECDHYTEEVRRVRQRNRRYDELGSAPGFPQTPADKFRTGTFLVILDSINSELQKRLAAYALLLRSLGSCETLRTCQTIKWSRVRRVFNKHTPWILKPVWPTNYYSFQFSQHIICKEIIRCNCFSSNPCYFFSHSYVRGVS